MGSTRDFLRSALTDALLPVTRQLLEDVVMELLTDRQVPSRSDFQDLRDLCNSLRGQVSASGALVSRWRPEASREGRASLRQPMLAAAQAPIIQRLFDGL